MKTISPGKAKSLGLEANPLGAYLVSARSADFQGVGTPEQYTARMGQLISALEEKIDNGEFLNTSFDVEGYARANEGLRLSREKADAELQKKRNEQRENQQGWKSYLSENDYSPEQRYILLSTVVKEQAYQENGRWVVRTLSQNTFRSAAPPSPRTAALFFEKFGQGEIRPAVAMTEAAAQDAAEDAARQFDMSSAPETEWDAGSLRWIRFEWSEKVPDENGDRAERLATLARTVSTFGMCSWCTGATSMAAGQLASGDFWVAVDEKMRARASFRLHGEKEIQEISGVLSGQTLEPHLASAVETFAREQAFTGGQKWIDDAKLRGRIASMENPGDWDEFKSVIDRSTDEAAVRFYREYRTPKGTEGHLVATSNAPLNSTLWEKTRHDGQVTPLDFAARNSQFSQAKSWVTVEMLDSPLPGQEDQPPDKVTTRAHELMGQRHGVSGSSFFRTLEQIGYLTSERQMRVGRDGETLTATAANDPAKLIPLAKLSNLEPASLAHRSHVTNKTGWENIATNRSAPREALEAMSILGSRELFSLEAQRMKDPMDNSFLHGIADLPAYRKNEEASTRVFPMEEATKWSWVDVSLFFEPNRGDATPLGSMPLGEPETVNVLANLRDRGALTPERQRQFQSREGNICHGLAPHPVFLEIASWDSTDRQAMTAPNSFGKPPLQVFFESNPFAASHQSFTSLSRYMDKESILRGYPIPEDHQFNLSSEITGNRTQPLAFPLAQAGALPHALKSGLVSASEISLVKNPVGKRGESPWHDAKLADTIDVLVEDGDLKAEHLLVEDNYQVTAAESLALEPKDGLYVFGFIQRRLGITPSQMGGLTEAHVKAHHDQLASFLSRPSLTREEITAPDRHGRLPFHYQSKTPYPPTSSDMERMSENVKRGVLLASDFAVPDPTTGEIPLADFAGDAAWVGFLYNNGLVDPAALHKVSPATRNRPLDRIPEGAQSTLLSMLRDGVITREDVLNPEDHSLFSKIIAVSPHRRSTEDFASAIQALQAAQIRPEDLDLEKLNILFNKIDNSSSPQAARSIVLDYLKTSESTEDVLFAPREDRSKFSRSRASFMANMLDLDSGPRSWWRDDPETFSAMYAAGLIPPARLSLPADPSRSEKPLVSSLLERTHDPRMNASSKERWTEEASKIIASGGLPREAFHKEYLDPLGNTAFLAREVFYKADPRIVEACATAGLFAQDDFRPGGALRKHISNAPLETLKVLVAQGVITSADVGAAPARNYRGDEVTFARAVFESSSSKFSDLATAGMISTKDLLSGNDGWGILGSAVLAGKTELLREATPSPRLQIGGDSHVSTWSGALHEMGAEKFVSLLRHMGMESEDIRASLLVAAPPGSPLKGRCPLGDIVLSRDTGSLLELIDAGIIKREDVTREFSAPPSAPHYDSEETIYRESARTLLLRQRSRWKDLASKGLLTSSDLAVEDPEKTHPVAEVMEASESPEEVRRAANLLVDSGLVTSESAPYLAASLSREGTHSLIALQALASRGVITPEALAAPSKEGSPVEILIKRSLEEGPEVLEGLRAAGAIPSESISRVDRAIQGKSSTIKDAMDNIQNKLSKIIGSSPPTSPAVEGHPRRLHPLTAQYSSDRLVKKPSANGNIPSVDPHLTPRGGI